MNEENINPDYAAPHPFRSEDAKEEYLTCYDGFSKYWPVVSECRTVDTSYGQTFVRVSGPGDAPPLVLLHGLGATSLSWFPNIEAWSEHYRTYAIDNIYDYGRSVYKRPMKTQNELLRWLDELFTALDLGDNINLVGTSYGGWLTGQYALHYQNRLKKVVLLAPACTVLPVRLEPLMRGILRLRLFLAPVATLIPKRVWSWMRRFIGFLLPHRYFTRRLFHWAFGDAALRDTVSQDLIEDFLNMFGVAQRTFKLKLHIPPTVLEDKELQSIHVPAIYIVGEDDKIYSAQKAVQRLKDVAPHIQTELVANTGHGLPLSQAKLVNRKVLEFLNDE